MELKNRFNYLYTYDSNDGIYNYEKYDADDIGNFNKTDGIQGNIIRRNITHRKKGQNKKVPRPQVALNEPVDYCNSYVSQYDNNNLTIIPGQRQYASIVKNNRKVCVIGDSHLGRIKKKLFNDSIINEKSSVNVFSGVTVQRLNHFVEPMLVEDKPDVVLIHVGCNNVTKDMKDKLNVKELSKNIIDIGLKCKAYGVDEVIISSILVKKDRNLTKLIRQVNNILRDECKKLEFSFICNDNISADYLCGDGIHLLDQGTYILGSNFVDTINNLISGKYGDKSS